MRSYEREKQPMIVPMFTVVDLDRVLLRTNEFYCSVVLPELERNCNEQGVSNEQAHELAETLREQELANRGRAFDFISYYNALMEQSGLHGIDVDQLTSASEGRARHLTEQAREVGALADGAVELLRAIDEEPGARWGIMTSGGEKTQQFKLAVVGRLLSDELQLLPRAMVIQAERKATEILEHWYDEERGFFVIPEALADGGFLYAEQVRLIDDKPKNLVMPEGAAGSDRVIPILAERPEGDVSEEGAAALYDIAARLLRRKAA